MLRDLLSNFNLLACDLTKTDIDVMSSLCATITSTLPYMQNRSRNSLQKACKFALNFDDNLFFIFYLIYYITKHKHL